MVVIVRWFTADALSVWLAAHLDRPRVVLFRERGGEQAYYLRDNLEWSMGICRREGEAAVLKSWGAKGPAGSNTLTPIQRADSSDKTSSPDTSNVTTSSLRSPPAMLLLLLEPPSRPDPAAAARPSPSTTAALPTTGPTSPRRALLRTSPSQARPEPARPHPILLPNFSSPWGVGTGEEPRLGASRRAICPSLTTWVDRKSRATNGSSTSPPSRCPSTSVLLGTVSSGWTGRRWRRRARLLVSNVLW